MLKFQEQFRLTSFLTFLYQHINYICKKYLKMKKVLVALVAISVAVGSCSKLNLGGKNHHGGDKGKKATITSEQTITLKAGESISITLPTADAHDGYAIITQATQAASSVVAEDLVTYTYTAPASLPFGVVTKDEVVVTNDHHTYPAIGHLELPGAEPNGCPQHYTVNIHVNLNGNIK